MISDLKMTHCPNRDHDVISKFKTSIKTFLFKEHFDLSYVRNIAMRILIFTFTFNLNFKIRIFNMFFYIFVLLLM